ncbi:hypothetical protein, partial [Stomatohabitans albus]
AIAFPFGSFLLHRYKVAKARLNYVGITADQYPEVFRLANELCAQAGISPTPPIFLIRDPSVDPCTLNPGLRNAIVLGTDFLAGSRENNTPNAVRFMLAHQIGHFVANHHKKRWLLFSAAAMGMLGTKTLIIRNLEFTADAYAATVVPEGTIDALALCAVGKDNYPYVNPDEQNRVARMNQGLMGFLAKWSADQVPPPERLRRLDTDGLLERPEDRVVPDHRELFHDDYFTQFKKA